MQQVHLFISGTVHGVGFRQFVKSHARKLGLVGWVKNTQDGKVEAVIQGEQRVIDALISLCRKGPFLAEVKDIALQKENTTKIFSSFDVVS